MAYTNKREELWADQTEANYEARQILAVGGIERCVGDLPDDAFNDAIEKGYAQSLKDIDEQYGLEYFYREVDSMSGLLYFCGKCRRNHYKNGSKVGEQHLKYQVYWLERAMRSRQFYKSLLGE